MARLWSGGFELNSGAIEFSSTNGAAATIQTTTKRSGAYAGKVLNPASGTRTGWAQRFANAAPEDVYARFYVYKAANPNALTTVMEVGDGSTVSSGTPTPMHTVKLTTGGVLSFRDGADVELGTHTLAADTWTRVEIRVESAGAGGTNILQVRVDGTLVVDLSDRTHSGSASCIKLGINLNAEANTAGELYFDDLAVNDGTGSAQTSWPGEGSQVHLYPNNAGDFAEGDSGPTGGLTAYQMVDETPTPNDATDYWKLITNTSANSSSADRLDVACEEFTPSVASITLVQVGVRVMPDTNASCSFVPRIKSQASGTVIEGTTTAITGTAWVTHDDTANTKQHKLTRYTDPQAGGAWTDGLLDSMQIGVRAPDGAPDVRVTSLWALVEYVPAASGSVAASDGLGTATGVGASTAASAGSSAGVATASAVGSATSSASAASDGVATVAAVGQAAAPAVGASDGIATASAVGTSTAASAAASSGVAAGAGVGASIAASDGAAAGVAAGSAAGASTAASAGSSAGLADGVGVGASSAAGVGAAAGQAIGSGVGAALAPAVGSAAGTSTAEATAATEGSSASAAGAATVEGVGASLAAAEASASGVATVAATGTSSSAAAFASAGSSTATAVGHALFSAAFLSTGEAVVTAVGASTTAGVGSAAGTSIVLGVAPIGGASSAVGTATGSSTAVAWSLLSPTEVEDRITGTPWVAVSGSSWRSVTGNGWEAVQ